MTQSLASSSLLSKDQLQNVSELVKTAQDSVASVISVLKHQILENADQIRETIKSNGKDGIGPLIENMLKAPIRKQSNRLEASTIGLKEVQRQLAIALAISAEEPAKDS